MIATFRLVRYAERRGDTVTWGNVVGPYLGQSATWRFADEHEAERFRVYASSDGAPALDTESLFAAGIPLPIEEIDG